MGSAQRGFVGAVRGRVMPSPAAVRLPPAAGLTTKERPRAEGAAASAGRSTPLRPQVGWFRGCRWLGDSTERGMDHSPPLCRSFSREVAGRGSRGGGASPREDMSGGRRTGPAVRHFLPCMTVRLSRLGHAPRGSTRRGMTGRQARREAGELAPRGVGSAGGVARAGL